MKKEITIKEWPDFTNHFLGVLGKFVLLPLVVLGGLISVFLDGFIGTIVIGGAALLFLLSTLLLVVFKPPIVKKHPEPKQELRSVSILVDIPGEGQKEETVTTTGKYRVSRKTPRKDLTRIQKLAVDKCNGDIEAALHYLFTYMSAEDQDAYTKNITPGETEAYMSLLNVKASELPSKELKKIVNQSVALAELNMSEDQVLAAKKNPFVTKLFRWIGGLLIACVVVGLVAGLGNRFIDDEGIIEAVSVLLGCGTASIVYKVVDLLMNSIRFRKVKHQLQEQKENS